jgi:hypothetical protein
MDLTQPYHNLNEPVSHTDNNSAIVIKSVWPVKWRSIKWWINEFRCCFLSITSIVALEACGTSRYESDIRNVVIHGTGNSFSIKNNYPLRNIPTRSLKKNLYNYPYDTFICWSSVLQS